MTLHDIKEFMAKAYPRQPQPLATHYCMKPNHKLKIGDCVYDSITVHDLGMVVISNDITDKYDIVLSSIDEVITKPVLITKTIEAVAYYNDGLLVEF